MTAQQNVTTNRDKLQVGFERNLLEIGASHADKDNRQRHNRVLEALANAGYTVQFSVYRGYPMRHIRPDKSLSVIA